MLSQVHGLGDLRVMEQKQESTNKHSHLWSTVFPKGYQRQINNDRVFYQQRVLGQLYTDTQKKKLGPLSHHV